MKHTVRSFSVGLLTSGIILLIAFYVLEDSAQTLEDLNPEEMIPVLEDSGYTVLTKEKYISLTIQNDEDATDEIEDKAAAEDESEKQTRADSEEEENTDEEAAEQEKTEKSASAANEQETEESSDSYTLTIDEGMASSDISSLLAEHNIIENAAEFNSYLNEHEYSPYIQIGSFELSSDMSFYQIAERIAN
ncbi:hypothetical protein [Oceanobacillus rekensis]|uniref:hypothetical protein n=1 Tax=Oceanobacillus rekensis TaxID=937927 RepID=UPI000B43F34E|nr:hypothetical protein [Oceanobacillus rekensis]